jgi:branched-chain amino acid aminotransferase
MDQRPLPDWNNLSFSFNETDAIFHSKGEEGRTPFWDEGEFLPFQELEFSPAAAFMSYGIGVFEGMKAQRARDGRVLLFRPAQNAERFRRSAERLLLAPYPADRFVRAVEEIVRRNLRFVPPAGKGSLYIRPMEHAVEAKLGLGPAKRFAVTIYSCPVGEYFQKSAEAKTGAPEGVRLQVLEQGRCAPGGTGFAKAMGNYAGGIAIAAHWKEKGFDDVLYLDARHVRYLTETSGSNVFVQLKSGALLTPPLDDQILSGITRDSVLRVAREVLKLTVKEEPVAIEQVLSEGEEVFCTGTAWTVQSVRELTYRGRAQGFPRSETRRALLEVLRGIQTGAREDPYGWTREVTLAVPESQSGRGPALTTR